MYPNFSNMGNGSWHQQPSSSWSSDTDSTPRWNRPSSTAANLVQALADQGLWGQSDSGMQETPAFWGQGSNIPQGMPETYWGQGSEEASEEGSEIPSFEPQAYWGQGSEEGSEIPAWEPQAYWGPSQPQAYWGQGSEEASEEGSEIPSFEPQAYWGQGSEIPSFEPSLEQVYWGQGSEEPQGFGGNGGLTQGLQAFLSNAYGDEGSLEGGGGMGMPSDIGSDNMGSGNLTQTQALESIAQILGD